MQAFLPVLALLANLLDGLDASLPKVSHLREGIQKTSRHTLPKV
jgi:hypothetical protein